MFSDQIQYKRHKLPAVALAWLPALLKISVQSLFAPEGRKISKNESQEKEVKNLVDWMKKYK